MNGIGFNRKLKRCVGSRWLTWACLRLGLSRTDRGDSDPDAARRRNRRGDRCVALRVQSVRCLLRGLPGGDQHPRGAGPPPKQGRGLPSRGSARSATGRDDWSIMDAGRRQETGGVADIRRDRRAGVRTAWTDRADAGTVEPVDRCPRPACPTAGVIPGLVVAHRRRSPRRVTIGKASLRKKERMKGREEILRRIRSARVGAADHPIRRTTPIPGSCLTCWVSSCNAWRTTRPSWSARTPTASRRPWPNAWWAQAR